MRLLLYCPKSQPYLIYDDFSGDYNGMCVGGWMFATQYKDELWNPEEDIAKAYNGKIVGECDFEIEETSVTYADYYHEELAYNTHTLTFDELLRKSCLNNQQLDNYLYGDKGYVIHIKNLHIFYTPKELSEFYKYNYKTETWSPVNKAPRNMMQVDYINIENNIFLPYILISIRPEWLCKILNEEKTIEVRRKILKIMLTNLKKEESKNER